MEMSLKAMRKMIDRDEILKRLGLEERTPAGDFFTGLGLFSVGMLAGAALGLLFAPRRGEEMRQAVGEAWRTRGRSGEDFGEHLGAEAGLGGSSARPS